MMPRRSSKLSAARSLLDTCCSSAAAMPRRRSCCSCWINGCINIVHLFRLWVEASLEVLAPAHVIVLDEQCGLIGFTACGCADQGAQRPIAIGFERQCAL